MKALISFGWIVVGLAVGGVVGWWIGRRWESERVMLWTMAFAAFSTAMIVDIVGFLTARPEISLLSVGLMAGIATGVKYGGFPDVRVWEQREIPAARSDEDADASAENSVPSGEPSGKSRNESHGE